MIGMNGNHNQLKKLIEEKENEIIRLKKLIEENTKSIKETRERLDKVRDSVNTDIFLSDDQKRELTAIIEGVYAPVNAEIAKAGHYEQVAEELLQKYSFRSN